MYAPCVSDSLASLCCDVDGLSTGMLGVVDTQCWCGNSFDKHGSLDESACQYRCAGDESQNCGGRNALSVYEASGAY